MSMLFAGWTVLVAVAFLAIAAWAYGRGRREDFDEAARIPLEDDGAEDELKRNDENG